MEFGIRDCESGFPGQSVYLPKVSKVKAPIPNNQIPNSPWQDN